MPRAHPPDARRGRRTLARTDHALVLRVSDAVDLDAYERLAASGRVDGFLLCDVELDDPRFERIELPAVVAGHPVSPCPFPWLETEQWRETLGTDGPIAFGDPLALLDEDVTAIVHTSDVLAAAAALLAAIAGEPVPAFRGAPPQLVPRASTAPPPGS
jgi:DNA-binding LacI/PurR family transcriptional regulator